MKFQIREFDEIKETNKQPLKPQKSKSMFQKLNFIKN